MLTCTVVNVIEVQLHLSPGISMFCLLLNNAAGRPHRFNDPKREGRTPLGFFSIQLHQKISFIISVNDRTNVLN